MANVLDRLAGPLTWRDIPTGELTEADGKHHVILRREKRPSLHLRRFGGSNPLMFCSHVDIHGLSKDHDQSARS